MSIHLEKILQHAQALSLEERQYLRQVLDESFPPTHASQHATEEAFQQQLVKAGLLCNSKRREAKQLAPRRKRVDIQGAPLSETVIEERR